MDREEAIRLLKGGIEGIREFNRRRDNGEELPNLNDANLSGMNLDSANLNGVDLHSANLSETDLCSANLNEATLHSANLSGAKLHYADLIRAGAKSADLSGAQLNNTDLTEADFQNANLSGVDLSSADLTKTYLAGANMSGAELYDANMSDADLRRTRGLRLNDTFIRYARFDDRAKDPWSVLRCSYTGPALLFNLIFLCTFLGVYAAKAAFWIGVNRSQQAALALADKLAATHPQLTEGLRALEPTLTEHSQKMAVWQVLLTMDRGPWLMILAVVLIAYNAARWLLTRQVAAMRDAEERSGFSPGWRSDEGAWRRNRSPIWLWAACGAIRDEFRGYRWCWLLHAWIARPLFWIAVMSFLWHAWHWLNETVYLPK